MKEIRLETEDGNYVVTGLMPPFLLLPGAVIWGERFFQLKGSNNPQINTAPIYREVFTVAIVQTKEGV